MQQPWPLGDNIGKGFPRLSSAAVEANGLSLKYLAPEMQGDKDLVMKAVAQNGQALQFATSHLRGDREVVLRAVSQTGDVGVLVQGLGRRPLRDGQGLSEIREGSSCWSGHQPRMQRLLGSHGTLLGLKFEVGFALSGAVESVGIWNLRQGPQEKALALHNSSERVSRLCVQEVGGSGRCAVGYQDGTVRLWDLKACAVLQTLQGHRSAVTCLCFDKAGHLMASGSNDTDLIVWDLVGESGIARLRGHVDAVTSVLFWEASAVRLISASKDRLIRIWSLEMQICLQDSGIWGCPCWKDLTAIAEASELWCLALNAPQTRLVCGSSEKFLHVWSLDHEAKTSEAGDLLLAKFQGAVPRTEGQGQALTVCFAHVGPLEVLLCQGSGRSFEIFRVFSDSEVAKRRKRRERRAKAKLRKRRG
eukprot:s899_g4.t1